MLTAIHNEDYALSIKRLALLHHLPQPGQGSVTCFHR